MKDSKVFGIRDSLEWLRPRVGGTGKAATGEMRSRWCDSNARAAAEYNQEAV